MPPTVKTETEITTTKRITYSPEAVEALIRIAAMQAFSISNPHLITITDAGYGAFTATLAETRKVL